MYRSALYSALSAKLAEGAIMVVSDLTIEQPKTRLLAKLLAQLGLRGERTLIVLEAGRSDLERAARNLSDVKLTTPEGLNVYDVLKHRVILIPEREARRLQEVWS
jgi:large subunit ribosomal protein L4